MNLRIAALDFIGRALAFDSDSQAVEILSSRIDSGKLDWGLVVGTANRQLVTPALWAGLRDKGLAGALPEEFREYVETLHLWNGERNLHLKRAIEEVAAELNGRGIEPLLLKGAANLFTDTFGDTGARMMSDVDMLVPPERFETCLEVLRALGYREVEEAKIKSEEHHHHLPLCRPGDFVTIELHRDLMSAAASRILPTETAWAHTRPVEAEGLRMMVLSPTCRVLHNIVHSEVVDRHHHKGLICLRQIHDLAAICARHGAEIDWETIRDRMERHGKAKVLASYLYLGHRMLGIPQPPEVRRTFGVFAHSLRCRLKIRFEWFDRWDHGLQRFSAWRIRRDYGCGSSIRSLTIARLRYARYLLKKYTGREA